MAADRAFQHNCAFCAKTSEGLVGLHLCSHCGRPQPMTGNGDYFSALGVSPRLNQDHVRLQRNFYEISRALHPDRFTTAGQEVRQTSIERMTLVNDAYRTLKDPATRRNYFLKFIGCQQNPQKKNAQIPMELAEDWFELQDAMTAAKLKAFEDELAAFKTKKAEALRILEGEIDTALDRCGDQAGERAADITPLTIRLAAEIQSESYLASMSQDVDRIRKRLN